MEFYRHADGSVTVDSFDDEISLTYDLLHCADPKFLQIDEDWRQVTILGACYQLVWADDVAGVAHFRR